MTTPLIFIKSFNNTLINFFDLSIQNIAYDKLLDAQSLNTTSFNNFKLFDTKIIQDKYSNESDDFTKPTYDTKRILISLTGFEKEDLAMQMLQINNIFVSNVQVQNIIFMRIIQTNQLYMRNITFTKESVLDYTKHNIQQVCSENNNQLFWVDLIFSIRMAPYIYIDTVTFKSLSFQGRDSIFVIQSILNSNVVIKNVNMYIDSQIQQKGYLLGFFFSFSQLYNVKILLQDFTLTIDAKKSYINLQDSAFFQFNSLENFVIILDQFNINTIYLQENPDFMINSYVGTFFSVGSSPNPSLQSSVIFQKMNITNINTSAHGGFAYIHAKSLIVKDSFFDNISTSGNGGVFCMVLSSALVITNSTFNRCKSDYLGGVLYLTEDYLSSIQYQFSGVLIQNCNALIGGGFVGPVKFKDEQAIKYINTSATLYGDEFSTNISKFNISRIIQYNPQFDSDDLKFIEIKKFSQNQIGNSNYEVYIEQTLPGLTYYIELQLYIDDYPIYTNSSVKKKLYSLTNYIISQQPSKIYLDITKKIESSQFFFMIQFPSLGTFSINTQQISLNTFSLSIHFIQSNECFQGQIYADDKCQFCDDSSVTNRSDTNQQTQCQTCNSYQFSKCYGYKSFLNQGFIRYNYFTINETMIQKCNHAPNNCEGGEFYGDNSCKISHCGPECLECDINNIRGNGTFVRDNSFQCQQCYSLTFNETFFILSFFIGILLILILYKVINQSIQSFKLEENNDEVVSCMIYFKLIIFYLNIIYVCSFYQTKDVILDQIFRFYTNLYNPFTGSLFSFFICYLKQVQIESFSLQHLQMIIIISCPYFFLLLYMLLKFLYHSTYYICKKISYQCKKSCLKKKLNTKQESLLQSVQSQDDEEQQDFKLKFIEKENYKNLLQLIVLIISSFSIQSIGYLIFGSMCYTFQQYGDVSILNLTLSCSNSELITKRNYLYIPLIILNILVLFAMLPFIFFKRKQQSEYQFSKFTIFFLEYNDKTFYWEFIRNSVRLIISIIIYTLFPSNNIIGFPIISVLVAYFILLFFRKPYKNQFYYKTELWLVFSGIIMILFYIYNTNSHQNGLSNGFVQTIVLIGNLQSFLTLLFLMIQFTKHLFKKEYLQMRRYFQRNRD